MNPRLVRGLDYYTHTAFEFVTETLGAQGAVIAGGRYDAYVRIRHQQALVPCTATLLNEESASGISVDTKEPIRAVASSQIAALYVHTGENAFECLGGGAIRADAPDVD